MPYVKSLRDVRVTTLVGHVITVPANVPTFVPPPALTAAQALGCVTCDEHGKITVDGVPAAAQLSDEDEIPFLAPEDRDDPVKRKRVITKAVVKCFKKNDRTDFGTNGCPKAGSITRMVGFQVTGTEIAEVVETLSADGN